MTLPRAALVNIDDLNAVGVIDDVHNTVEGKPLANALLLLTWHRQQLCMTAVTS